MKEYAPSQTLTVSVWPDERVLKMSKGIFEFMFVRDNQGNKMSIEWGEPNPDGSYTPMIHIDYSDNIVTTALAEERGRNG